MRKLFLIALCLCVFGVSHVANAEQASAPVLASKRVLWLGDSITQNGTYVSFVEYYLNKQFPTQKFDIISVGLASETVSGLSEKQHPFPRPNLFERLNRALDATKPDVVVACYGMNDGIYHPQSAKRMKAFQKGVRNLASTVKRRGAKLILLTPPPFDALPVKNLQKAESRDFAYFAPYENYDSVLADYAAWEKTLSSPDVSVIDLHAPMSDYLKTQRVGQPAFTFAEDGIHPNDAGQLLMADTILNALEVPVPSADLNAQLQEVTADPLWPAVKQHREMRSSGWLPFIGYTRDKKVKTVSVADTEKAATALQAQADDLRPAIRVACVGDSITAGVGTSNPFMAYPAQLQRILGKKWEVRNFGVSATTLLNSGDKPYQKETAMKNALNFKPNVVVIMLGTNDSKPQNWAFKTQFGADYRDLVGKFKALETQPRILACNPPFVPGVGNFGINEPAVVQEIPLIKTMTEGEKIEVVDVHGAFVGKDALFPDRVHPNNEGASVLAKTVYAGITGDKWDGEVPDVVLSDWNGFEQKNFLVANRSCLLVSPKTAAPGNPWIWRTEFFGHEPQGDIALLNKGWHVAYMDVQNMYGAPIAIDLMDQFYKVLVNRYQLSPKAVLEGFSRGGLFALNWALRNPTQVSSLYLDAPLTDLRNWPADMPTEWEQLKKIYGLTEEQARAYALSPVDHLQPLADAKVPILGVYGMADTTVIPEKNIELLAQRYQAMGGEIELIPKPGIDHHPHSLVDPTPIVNFVIKHFR